MKTTYEEKLIELMEVLGEEKAKKLVKLSKNYDNYINRFKKEVNKILADHGYQVLTGLVFKQKGDK